jgi:hypothetical protein
VVDGSLSSTDFFGGVVDLKKVNFLCFAVFLLLKEAVHRLSNKIFFHE